MLEVDSEQTRFVGMAQPPVMVGSSRSDSDRTPLPPIRAAEWQGKKPTRTKALPPTMRKARWQHFKHAKLAAFLAEASVFFSRWLLMRQRRIGWSDALALSRICGIYWWYFRFIFESSANPSCGSLCDFGDRSANQRPKQFVSSRGRHGHSAELTGTLPRLRCRPSLPGTPTSAST